MRNETDLPSIIMIRTLRKFITKVRNYLLLSKLQNKDFFLKGFTLKYVNKAVIPIDMRRIIEYRILIASDNVVESYVIACKAVIIKCVFSTNNS